MLLSLFASLAASSAHLPALPTAPLPQAPGSSFRYSYLEIAAGRENLAGLDEDADTLAFGGSFELNDTWFTRFGYGLSSLEVAPLNVDQTTLSVGLGLHTTLAKQIDLYGVVSYLDYSVDSTIGGMDVGGPSVDGLSYAAGARMHASSWLELDFNYTVVDVDEFSIADRIGVNAVFDVSSTISLNAQFSTSDDNDLSQIGVRFHF